MKTYNQYLNEWFHKHYYLGMNLGYSIGEIWLIQKNICKEMKLNENL